MDRRKFVTSLTAATAVGGYLPADSLQENRGIRDQPLRTDFWGPLHYDEAERDQVVQVIDTGLPFRFGSRKGMAANKVAGFEKEFAAKIGTRFALAVSSGTTALECAVAALGIGPGDEVILPAWTWHSTCTAIVRAGALPVFAEIDESFNLDPDDIEHRITPATRLIIAVHLQGNPAAMDPILAIAAKYRIRILEDAAQCVGGKYKGRRLGSLGNIGIYSHQESKTITAGEGGSVVTNDPELFERACRFHNVGNLAPVHQQNLGQAALEPFVGTNARMNELTGGVMLAQVRKLDSIIAAVRDKVAVVLQGIQDVPGIRFRIRPDPDGDLGSPVFLRFDSKSRRDLFLEMMKADQVPAAPPGGSVILPIVPYIEKKRTAHPGWPTWNSPRGKAIQYGAASCPRTIDILNRFAGVAVGPKYTRQDLQDIISAIRKNYPKAMQS